MQQVGPQVVLHHPQLADVVGDRGTGGECHDRGTVALLPAQPVDLHVQVGGLVRSGGREVVQPGVAVQVLVVVGLVDDEVVAARVLETDPVVVLDGLDPAFHGLGERLGTLLDLLDRRLGALHVLETGHVLLHLENRFVDVALLGLLGQGHRRER